MSDDAEKRLEELGNQAAVSADEFARLVDALAVLVAHDTYKALVKADPALTDDPALLLRLAPKAETTHGRIYRS